MTECYIDTMVANELLGASGKDTANHSHSCSKICGSMDSKFTDKFAVGIIDADKKQPTYVNDFNVVNDSLYDKASRRGVEVLKHRSRPHYLLRVSPAMDGFLLDTANECQLDLADFDLPSELPSLLEVTKHATARQNQGLRRLIKRLKAYPKFGFIKDLLQHLNQKRYNADISGDFRVEG